MWLEPRQPLARVAFRTRILVWLQSHSERHTAQLLNVALPARAILCGCCACGCVCGHQLSLSVVSKIVEVVASLKEHGCNVVIVTSGAVGVGARRLGMTEKPKNMATKQAVAAVGQGRLLRIYDDLFELAGVPVAQVHCTAPAAIKWLPGLVDQMAAWPPGKHCPRPQGHWPPSNGCLASILAGWLAGVLRA